MTATSPKARERASAALLYHHVGPASTSIPRSLTVSPARFARQMRMLAIAGWRGVSARDWQARDSRPSRIVMVTFDDAYADLIAHALPVLRRLRFTATVFAVGELLGGENEWDGGGARLMSQRDLRAWVAGGMELGAHGQTHVDLTGLDAPGVEAEVHSSKMALTDLIAGPVEAFAYPYGAYNEVVRETVGRHFQLAFGVAPGLNQPGADLLALRRTMVQPADTVTDVLLRAQLGRSPLMRLRGVARPRSRLRELRRPR